MFLVRNVFTCKPGKAKQLVEVFRKAAPLLAEVGIRNTQILTDASATFWTVAIHSEVEDLNTYLDMAKVLSKKPEIGEVMKGYADLVTGGHREIFRIET